MAGSMRTKPGAHHSPSSPHIPDISHTCQAPEELPTMQITIAEEKKIWEEYDEQGLPNLIGRWLPSGLPRIATWLPNNDWW